MESRNSYGWGLCGSSEKGFEWLLVFGTETYERLSSGYVYKTEAEALKEGRKFQKESKYEPHKKGSLSAIKAKPLHFEY